MQPINAIGFFKTSMLGGCRNALVKGLSLSLGLAALMPAAADAQYYARGWGGYGPYAPYGGGPYDDGGYYVPDDEGPEYRGPRYGYGGPVNDPAFNGPSSNNRRPAQKEAEIVSLDAIQKKIRAAGFKLIAAPRHKGNIYLAEVEDAKSIRHRLVYDAHDGHLIENTSLGPVKKLNAQPDEPKDPSKPDRSGDVSTPKAGAVSDLAYNLPVSVGLLLTAVWYLPNSV
jgi:hypothetical protein